MKWFRRATLSMAVATAVIAMSIAPQTAMPQANAQEQNLFKSSEGREFFVTFDANLLGFESRVRTDFTAGVPLFAEQWLYISGDPGTELQVHFPPINPVTGIGSYVQNVTIGTSGVESVNASERLVTKTVAGGRISSITGSFVNGLPAVAFNLMTGLGRSSSDGVAANALRVQVTSPGKKVAVYGANLQRLTSDAFSAVPTQSLGLRYRAVAWNHLEFASAERPSRISVIATQSGTTSLTITPPGGHSGLYNSGDKNSPRTTSYSVTLQLGEVYSVTSNVDPAGLQDDITGTLIVSDKEVVVASGNECAQVGEFGSCDHLIQYMPPVSAWGDSYILASSVNSTLKDVYRVVADTDGTTLELNGTQLQSGGVRVVLAAGEYHEFSASSTRAFDLLETNHPVMVAKFISGGHPNKYFWGYTGDPALSIMTPTLQFLDSYRVSTPSAGFTAHSINIVIPTDDIESLVVTDLDTSRNLVRSASDRGPNGQRGTIPGTSYSFVRLDVPGGAFAISADEGIGVYVEGFNDYDSYSYVGGMAFVNLQDNPEGALSAQREAENPPAPAPAPQPSSSPSAPSPQPPLVSTSPPRTNPTPRVSSAVPPAVQQGPVLRGNVPPVPPRVPRATRAGAPMLVESQLLRPDLLSVQSDSLLLNFALSEEQGLIRDLGSGAIELEVKKGASAALSGSGLLPRSTVQVFLPLQGNNAKEVARIPVDGTGSFSGDAVFATRPTERPLPIGRQVLQVVSLDEEGQQSVVEMTVNVAQPAPAPEPDRTAGATPTLRPGQVLATNAGQAEIVTVVALPEDNRAVVEGDGWQMAVNIPGDNGSVQRSGEGGAVLELVRDETAVVSGSGFMPLTRADVWLFSDPTLLGTVDIDENGEFNGEVNVDGRAVSVGEHTLQLQGVGMDGYVRAANLGVIVNDATLEVTTEESAGGFLWWLWIGLATSIILIAFFWRRYLRRLPA
jgi:IgGFc binding protein